MKHIFFLISGLFFSVGAFSLPISNPADPILLTEGLVVCRDCSDEESPCSKWCENVSFRFGFYGDYVFNRRLEAEFTGHPQIRKTELYTNAAILTVNFLNRIDLFATLGTSKMNLIFEQSLFSLIAGQIEIGTQTDFSWSVGVKGTLFEFHGLALGVEGQYFRFQPNLEFFNIAAVEITFPFITDIEAKYREWQGGIGLSYRINITESKKTALVPYVGYKISRVYFNFLQASFMDGTIGVIVSDTDVRNKKRHGGFSLGLTLLGADKASVTAEARFIDEKALFVNSQFRF